eukprot:Skav223597  [mRNA]  locus=scaffold493:315708:319679:+ [translate_table: standard]
MPKRSTCRQSCCLAGCTWDGQKFRLAHLLGRSQCHSEGRKRYHQHPPPLPEPHRFGKEAFHSGSCLELEGGGDGGDGHSPGPGLPRSSFTKPSSPQVAPQLFFTSQ